MKKIGAFIGVVAVIGMLFPVHTGIVTAAEQSMSESYPDNTTAPSDDIYAVTLTTDYTTSNNTLNFTFAGKKYSVKFYSNYVPELMLCAVQKATHTEGATADIGLLESVAKTLYSNLYLTLKTGEKLDCEKNSDGYYESVYKTSSAAYDIAYAFNNPFSSTITITPKNGDAARVIVMDLGDVDLLSCALIHEEGTTFAELDKNLLVLVADAIHISYGYTIEGNGYFFTPTKSSDCVKTADGIYRKQSSATHGDYTATLHSALTASGSIAHAAITNAQRHTQQEILIAGYYLDIALCAVEDAMGVPFEKMDADLRDTLADLFAGNVAILKEFGTLLESSCTKGTDGAYILDTDTSSLKEKVATGIELIDIKLAESEDAIGNVKRSRQSDEYSPYEYARENIISAKESLKYAKKMYRDEDYETALYYLHESLTTIFYAQDLISTDESSNDPYSNAYDAYSNAYDTLNERFIDFKKKGIYEANKQKFDEITTLLDEAYTLYAGGSNAESLATSKKASTKIDQLK